MHMLDRYAYDSAGNCTTSVRLKYEDLEDNLDSPSNAYIRTETGYDAKKNYAISNRDARGNTVTRNVDSNTGLIRSVTDPAGQTVQYSYDADHRVTAVETQLANGGKCKNSYTYEKDRIKTVAHNTTTNTPDVTYTFNYDQHGRKTSVKVGNQVLSTNVYTDDRSGLLQEVQYGNGGKASYEYDDFDRLTAVRWDGETEPRCSYEYGYNGQAALVKDHHLGRSTRTEFDLSDRPCKLELRDEKENLLYRTQLKYDKYSNLKKFHETLPGETHSSGYSYDRDNRITAITYDGDTHKVNYAYDSLGRITGRTATSGTNAFSTSYTFAPGGYGDKSTSPLVAKITQPGMDLEYTYDSRGNITHEIRGGKTTDYFYDELGQLIRVNDPHENKTWLYNYDRGGNLLSRMRYSYWTGSLGAPGKTFTYTYGDSNWKDKLTSFDGVPITYDAIGNPLSDGERYYSWACGRQLQSISMPLTGALKDFIVRKGVHRGSNMELSLERSGTGMVAKVYRDGDDISSSQLDSRFVWNRESGDAEADAAWAASRTGKRTISLTSADLTDRVKITCTYTSNELVFGTVTPSLENGILTITHTPGKTDTADTFSCDDENNLIVTRSSANKGRSYFLKDGKLYANNGFNGALTATATYSTVKTREIDFEYNHSGLRTKKVIKEGGVTTTTEYIYHGKLVTHLIKTVVDASGNQTSIAELHFFYDAQSRPAFVKYNNAMYRYIHNLQGDIIGIVDAAGTLVVEYKYDSWGKPLGTLPISGIGAINPFRYRGYVWDGESELYYLRTRYYHAMCGRFINLDKYMISSQRFGGINVFAYCVNSPVQGVDPDGKRYIDALSVTAETKKQRYNALVYTNETRPKKASLSVVNAIDKYLNIRNFDRISEVYEYYDGDTQYFYTTIGGMWIKDISQYIAKYEKCRAVFGIETYESMSIADAISIATDIASVYYSTYAPFFASNSWQSAESSFIADAFGTLSNQYNNMDFGQLAYTPLFSFSTITLEECTFIN